MVLTSGQADGTALPAPERRYTPSKPPPGNTLEDRVRGALEAVMLQRYGWVDWDDLEAMAEAVVRSLRG